MSTIKTPDQRVRVFISSTIGELAEERKAATEAIKKLHLTPVLFEMSARPHPPRDLYRAYLEQSHIFVGIYWNSYGWIAPGMEISGLEDEYLLSEGKTRLIYIKRSSGQRDEKLTSFIAKIESSGDVSYREFSNAAELRELLENDLALLLSEQFEHQKKAQNKPGSGSLPLIHTPLIGREKELQELQKMISRPEIGLITLTGTGGTGKTRLAIQLAHAIKDSYKDEAYYVPLASVADETLVAATIAHRIGLYDSGKQSIKTTLLDYLSDKSMLLVLDNFEQILGAAVLVSQILERCASIKLIVTSRSPLHIRGEHIITVMPLRHPDKGKSLQPGEILKFPSVELFIQRAKSVNPHLSLDDKNIHAISDICRRLDGLPLAIELAASRTKFLTPIALLGRMKTTLNLLTQGPRDMPDRQKTLRATIDWSYKLLDDCHQQLFRYLSVFSNGWTLEACQAIVRRLNCPDIDILEATERLLDFGLIHSFSYYNANEASVEPRFTMLQTILEYSSEMMKQRGEAAAIKKAHADHFIALAEHMDPGIWLPGLSPFMDQIERDYQNVRAAFWNSLEANRPRVAWRLVRAMNHSWMTDGRVGEAVKWVEAAGISHDSTVPGNGEPDENKLLHAGALLSSGIVMYSTAHYAKAKQDLERSAQLYREINLLHGASRALVYLGVTGLSSGDREAINILQEAKALSENIKDDIGIIASDVTLAEVLSIIGKVDIARKLIDEGEHLSRKIGNNMMIGVSLMQKGNLLIALRDFEGAKRAYKESLSFYRVSGFKVFTSWSNVGLAHCYREQNDFDSARKEYQTGIDNGRQTGEVAIVALGLLGMAMMALKTAQHEKATCLLGRVNKMVQELGYSLRLADRHLHQTVTGETRSKLSDEAFNREYDLGKKISTEQAIALAMEDKKKKQDELAH